jgi:hypothetical protein
VDGHAAQADYSADRPKLWVDDLDYAERRYELKKRGEFPG